MKTRVYHHKLEDSSSTSDGKVQRGEKWPKSGERLSTVVYEERIPRTIRHLGAKELDCNAFVTAVVVQEGLHWQARTAAWRLGVPRRPSTWACGVLQLDVELPDCTLLCGGRVYPA
ncbi:hypothetical protein NDU88_003303 [Pleurodeles waltl]|uniref:Uncharacterized protein n=1 Tax=Pleurodeles waltl TaxID=8319 RepID=A0AAV7MQ70_PLEWA|nr:hypothetical protein NDU88_003303 [Pleurodeles waltl]